MSDLKKMKVLLVDDDESIRVSMAYYFRKKTALFKAVETAERGLDAIRDMGRADIVVSDYKLPGMDGLCFLECVKHRWPNARTVLITAHSSVALKSKAQKIGIDGFIQKPFTTQTILDALTPP